MVAEVSSEARGCNVVGLAHVEDYQARNYFPTISLGEVEAAKKKYTLAKRNENIEISFTRQARHE